MRHTSNDGHIPTFSALGIDPDRFPDRRDRPMPGDPDFIAFVEGKAQDWSMAEHARAFLGVVPCPVCGCVGDERPPEGWYCLGCDRGPGGVPKAAPRRAAYRRGELAGGRR